jgi:hypothetical protein
LDKEDNSVRVIYSEAISISRRESKCPNDHRSGRKEANLRGLEVKSTIFHELETWKFSVSGFPSQYQIRKREINGYVCINTCQQ